MGKWRVGLRPCVTANFRGSSVLVASSFCPASVCAHSVLQASPVRGLTAMWPTSAFNVFFQSAQHFWLLSLVWSGLSVAKPTSWEVYKYGGVNAF